VQAAPNVTQVFTKNQVVQKTMGFNCKAVVDEEGTHPNMRVRKVVSSLRGLTPEKLVAFVGGSQLNQIGEFNFSSKDVIATGSYV
jgi:hypothetical protein